jgi:diguanylate cyclase (GGDEF)-like protein
VLFVDLDGLKTLNDTLGHERADDVIRHVAGRLSGAVRSDELVGRFGGDEFVVIAPRVTADEEAAELGFRLLDAISKPILEIASIEVTASVGIAMVGACTTDAREAIRQADSAMYAAKRAGRGGCSFFEGSQRLRTGRRHSMARELRDAEMRGEMHLVFQPVVDLASSAIVSVEAPPRWTSPTFGEVSPDEFIPIAEDTGTIVPLGAWVLRESCERLAAITEQTGRSLELAVNVSALQLARPAFAKTVRQTLAHTEFPAQRLTLEVAETALTHPDTETNRTMHQLDRLAIRIVLDDFGTGHSSLRWLKHHPFHGIKIDGTFVSGLPDDVTDRAVVAAVVGIAGALGCPVTAVGVDDRAQLDAVRALNCDRAQGSLLGRPVLAGDLAALLRAP